MQLVRFSALVLAKYAFSVLYRLEKQWVSRPTPVPYSKVRVLVLLNHTSLMEPVYLSALPLRFLWRLASRGVVPGADKTLQRPILGKVYRLLVGRMVSISRKRDATWDGFMGSIQPESLILIAPEGRMKRLSGYDRDGMPMTVRGGIADILNQFNSGSILLAYSGGLHHVLAPEQRFPRFFKRIALRLELLDLASYKASIGWSNDAEHCKQAVIDDLTRRMQRHCPWLEHTSGHAFLHRR